MQFSQILSGLQRADIDYVLVGGLAVFLNGVSRVTLYTYSGSAHIWWAGVQNKLTRLSNLTVWQIPAAHSQALAALAERTMQLQITVQDAQIWVGNGERSVEVHPTAIRTATAR